MSIPTDIQKELIIIENAKKDKKHFGSLYEKYYKQIFIFIFKKIQNENLTADICSKTFIKAMVNIDKYKYKGFPFSSWLYRIASNEVNMFFRENKKKHTVQIMEKDIVSLMGEIDEDPEISNINNVLSLLEKLPLEQNQLIEMRFFEQLSFKKIASIFAITEANAKMKVYRILAKLNKELKSPKQA